MEQKVKKFNNSFLSHNYSNNNSFNSDSPHSLLTEKRLLKGDMEDKEGEMMGLQQREMMQGEEGEMKDMNMKEK